MSNLISWLLAHPEWLEPIVMLLVGSFFSLIAPPMVRRFPALAPMLDYILHKLPVLFGSIDKTRTAAAEAKKPPEFPGDKP